MHLVNHSPNIEQFLPRICNNLTSPSSSSPNSAALSLAILTTIFNILPADDDTRYHVFLAILQVIRSTVTFEVLKPQLKNLENWVALWELDEEDQQKLYLTVADVAEEAGDRDQCYAYLLRALRIIPQSDVAGQTAHDLALRALKSALAHPAQFDFQDLINLDAIQALRKSEPVYFELLDIFNSEQLEEYDDFQEEHSGFIEGSGLDGAVLTRKMRLLTLASLAAASQTRSLPYQHIARALKVAEADVEMWVIDVIRAGLVEGKLSQLNQTFLIHRSTYRVFGEKQWTEVAGRLDTWRTSLEGVLAVVRTEREKMLREKERELKDIEAKAAGQGERGVRGPRNQRREQQPRDDIDLNGD